jgi:BASS family bile acid:Na+ symporter
MSLDQILNLLVTTTLIAMMVTVGLQVTVTELAYALADYRTLLRAGVANYLFVPALTILLLVGFDANPMVAAGFLVLAVFPGAPFGPPLVAIAGGNLTAAAGLMTALAASSTIVSPILLFLLLPWLLGGDAPQINLLGIIATLTTTQLLPLLLGIVIRYRRSQVADWLHRPAELISRILGVSVAALILITQFNTLAEVRPRGFLAMLVLLLGSLLIGWIAGNSAIEARKTLALTTALRNVGVALVVVTGNFGGTAAVSATLVYGIIEIFGSLLLALYWARDKSQNPQLNP